MIKLLFKCVFHVALSGKTKNPDKKKVISILFSILHSLVIKDLHLYFCGHSIQTECESKTPMLQGVSKDSSVVLSIAEPVCGKFHLFLTS